MLIRCCRIVAHPITLDYASISHFGALRDAPRTPKTALPHTRTYKNRDPSYDYPLYTPRWDTPPTRVDYGSGVFNHNLSNAGNPLSP